LDASEKHLKDELENALKKEEVIVRSETVTSLSDSTEDELKASGSIKLKALEEKKKDLVRFVPKFFMCPLR
jgi:flagellar basal body-associated protein FliL